MIYSIFLGKKKIEGRDAAEIQQKLFNAFKNTIGSKKHTLVWKDLPGELIDAANVKIFQGLSEDQLTIFWKLVDAFVAMVEKRGFNCLWDASVYYALGVEGWFKVLLWLAEVEKLDESECLVRPGTVDRRQFIHLTYGLVGRQVFK